MMCLSPPLEPCVGPRDDPPGTVSSSDRMIDDMDGICLPPGSWQTSPAGARRRTEREARRRSLYVPPVPLAWINRAAKLPGRALQVGLLLRMLARMRGSGGWCRVSIRALMDNAGVSRSTMKRGIEALRNNGLVRCQSEPGCALTYQIVEDECPAP